MGGWCEGRCQEAGREKLKECCKEQGQLVEASKEGLGLKWAVVPMLMITIIAGADLCVCKKLLFHSD
jgi:hypothetical protein